MPMKSKSKCWTLGFFALVGLLLLVLCGQTLVVDPYFHYHTPLPGLSISSMEPRHQADGILRNFEYDTVLTGSSMAENFKTSQLDELFGTKSVKVPLWGASYKEIDQLLRSAVERNPDIRYIFRCLDYKWILMPAGDMFYDPAQFPTYLYDDDPFNDVQYFMNKDVLLEATDKVLADTYRGGEPFNFDTYCRWHQWATFGKEAVLKAYDRPEQASQTRPLTQKDREMIDDNIQRNVLDLARENPQITFYLFLTPYSICYFDGLNRQGTLERELAGERYAIELMLSCDNVRLFSFLDQRDMICDLDHYRDAGHYGEEVNEWMLQWMKNGEHQLTKENYLDYCNSNESFFLNYDYDAIFADSGADAS